MKRALPLVLFGGAALLFCLGVVALGANFFLGQSGPVDLTQWKAPLEQVEPRRITPAIALEPLAGTSDTAAIDDALQAGDWETALAAVAYTPDLDDAARAGTLLTLGSRYAAGKQTAKAAWVYHYAATLAVISPVPSDLVRAQVLLQAAQGLQAIAMNGAARSALDQAYLIIQHSPAIPRDSRARLYGQASDLYSRLGAGSLSAQARKKGQDAAAQTTEDPGVESRRPFRPALGDLPASDEVKTTTDDRVTAAKELIDELTLHPPVSEKALPQDLIRALGDRLFEEDQARQAYYTAHDQAAPRDPAVRAAVLRDHVRWLGYKLRIARRGFGLSLMPEWETGAKKIAAELSDTYDQLAKLSEEQAGKSDQAADADGQTEDVLRGELVAGLWGHLAFDENDLRGRLDEVEGRLRDDQVLALRLDSYVKNKIAYYLVVPDELYGQGEKALPK